jgi:glycosyltransferase involved in cell wall biosynthesis
VIGIAGRINLKQKGHDTFVEAAEVLLRERPGLTFAIAGDGPDRPRLERMIEDRRLESSFRLLGYVSPIEQFLSAVDWIAIPSRFEGLGLIALEALALGVPGVAASCDGLCDIWPSRWRVEPGDAVGLAAKIATLLDLDEGQVTKAIDAGRRHINTITTDNVSAEMASIVMALA